MKDILEMINRVKLEDILGRHGLTSKWKKFQERYLDE